MTDTEILKALLFVNSMQLGLLFLQSFRGRLI